jgi:hypothetical protein
MRLFHVTQEQGWGSRMAAAVCTAVLAAALGALAPSAPAADMEVGSGKPFATIQDAINAATSGVDRVVVYTGVYNEQVVWNKVVDIVAAAGNDPVLQFLQAGKGDVIVVGYTGTATWDGIDVVLDQPNSAGTVFFNLNGAGTTTNVRNLRISDTPNAVGGNPKTFFTHGGCTVNIDHLTFASENGIAEGVLFCQVGSKINVTDSMFIGTSDKFTWINQAGPDATKITCTRCLFTKPDLGGHLVMSYHGEIELNDCQLILDGGVKRGVITLNSNQAQKLTLNRCVLDGRKEAGGRVVNIEGDQTDMQLTNCALVLRKGAFGVYGSLGGKVGMTHCTVASASADAANTGVVMNGGESAGKTLTLTLENNVFSLPGSEVGAVSYDATQGGTLTLTAGTNLRDLAGGGGAATDALTGTIIDAAAGLAADFIHLASASAAIDAGPDVGVTDDIDGESRPAASETPGFDLGADEFQGSAGPAPPSDLVATAGNESVSLTWTAPSGGSDVIGYNVYQTSPGEVTKLNTSLVTETSFVATGLTNDVEACFVVRSVAEGDLESSDSNVACATPTASGALQVPGDCNQDGKLDISDAVCLLGHLFLGNPTTLPCDGGTILDPGNLALLNSNGDVKVDLSDAVYTLLYLFNGGTAPVLGTSCQPIGGCPSACSL